VGRAEFSSLWVDVEVGNVFVGRLSDGMVETSAHYEIGDKSAPWFPVTTALSLLQAQDRLVVIATDGSRRDGPSILSGRRAIKRRRV